jgi:hypothetical protein
MTARRAIADSVPLGNQMPRQRGVWRKGGKLNVDAQYGEAATVGVRKSAGGRDGGALNADRRSTLSAAAAKSLPRSADAFPPSPSCRPLTVAAGARSARRCGAAGRARERTGNAAPGSTPAAIQEETKAMGWHEDKLGRPRYSHRCDACDRSLYKVPSAPMLKHHVWDTVADPDHVLCAACMIRMLGCMPCLADLLPCLFNLLPANIGGRHTPHSWFDLVMSTEKPRPVLDDEWRELLGEVKQTRKHG